MATKPLQNGPQGPHTDHDSALTRFGRKFTESRYFMVSLIVHLIVIVIAGSIVLYRSVVPVDDFASAGDIGGLTTEPSPDLTQNPERPPEISTPVSQPVMNIPQSPQPGPPMPPSDSLPTSMSLPSGMINVRPFGAAQTTTVRVPMPAIGKGAPGIMSSRFGDKKIEIGKKIGMSDKAIPAVRRSLAWLRDHQNPDGSWGDTNKGAMTGLALLCYLGFGETPDTAFGLQINRAIEWLLVNGAKSEGRLSMEKTFSQSGVYEHAIATYALGEFYAITHDERVTYVLTQAVAHIVQGQGPGGGWMYSYDKTADDLSVSGWQIQALKAAHLTGLKLPGVDQALDKAITCIERVRGPKGGYGYRGPEDRYSLTGAGILSSLFWKGDRRELQKGMQWLLDETEKNKPVKYRGPNADLYAWYYHTQACLMFGGPAWTKWNKWFQDELITAQNADGSWPVPGARATGPQSAETMTGAVYRTTLCTLMLEVFYRYMPVNRG